MKLRDRHVFGQYRKAYVEARRRRLPHKAAVAKADATMEKQFGADWKTIFKNIMPLLIQLFKLWSI